MEKLGIIIVIESGDLEQKTKLLIESIRTFGGAAKDSKIWAVKPRKGKRLKKKTLEFLDEHLVEYIDIDLNKHWYLYGLANKIYASAYIEEKFSSDYETLLFLDSDTIVFDDLDVDILEGRYDVAVKPENSDYFTIPIDARLSEYWKLIYRNCDVTEKEVWTVKTTVSRSDIFAFFNSGVIFSNSKCYLFQKWLKNFKQLTKDVNAYHLRYMEYYFLEQALLSGTLINHFSIDRIKILDTRYNYPLPFQNILQKTIPFHEIKIVHYFELLKSNCIEELSNFPPKIVDTLKYHLPIEERKEQLVNRYIKVCNYIIWRFTNKCLIIYKKFYERHISEAGNNNSC